MPYIYEPKSSSIPEDVEDKLDALTFEVDRNMNLIAVWDSGEDDPFTYYLNADYELI